MLNMDTAGLLLGIHEKQLGQAHKNYNKTNTCDVLIFRWWRDMHLNFAAACLTEVELDLSQSILE